MSVRYEPVLTMLLLILMTGAGSAQKPKLYVYDPGNLSCGKFLSAVYGQPPGSGRSINRSEGTYYAEGFLFRAWVGGFLSATNLWVTDERNDIQIDHAAIDVWMRKWCEQNPTKPVIEAVSAFVWDQRREYMRQWCIGRSSGPCD